MWIQSSNLHNYLHINIYIALYDSILHDHCYYKFLISGHHYNSPSVFSVLAIYFYKMGVFYVISFCSENSRSM